MKVSFSVFTGKSESFKSSTSTDGNSTTHTEGMDKHLHRTRVSCVVFFSDVYFIFCFMSFAVRSKTSHFSSTSSMATNKGLSLAIFTFSICVLLPAFFGVLKYFICFVLFSRWTPETHLPICQIPAAGSSEFSSFSSQVNIFLFCNIILK